MTRLELTAILKALRFAGNSMTCDTAYALDQLLGFCPIRPSVYMESCMLRSAHKTFVGFEEQHKQLTEVAMESSCFALAFRTIIPPGWDSPAFATNLTNALHFRGLEHSSNCANELETALAAWSTRRKAISLQKIFHNTIHNQIYREAFWVEFIRGKLSIFHPEGAVDFCFTSEMWKSLCSDLKKAPPPSKPAF